MGVVEGGEQEPLVLRDDTPRQHNGTQVTATAKMPDLPILCSPQLLHLDLDGRPLWFNGWLVDDKFAATKDQVFSKFEHYLVEPPQQGREPSGWTIESHNRCCLSTPYASQRVLTIEEKQLLRAMAEQAMAVRKGMA